MSLYVKKGNTKFSVNVHDFPLDQIKAKEKTLAEEIILYRARDILATQLASRTHIKFRTLLPLFLVPRLSVPR